VKTGSSSSILARHEFFIRRLHSLTGLVPVGAYMTVHLLVNASVLSGASTFQKNVYQIHALEDALLLVEWAFIFLPILFHAILGAMIVCGGLPNTGAYPYGANIRYTLQRATGIIAFAFIVWHVFHLHGWFHFDAWLEGVARPLNGANFKPFNAASTLGAALSSVVVQILYATGMLACVFHLANGVWTMGITWGVWVSPAAQRRAYNLCAGFGIVLAVVGLSALAGASRLDIDAARAVEDRMYEAKVAAGDIKENDHKRSSSQHNDGAADREADADAASDE
jgi:succinate dehydrogenase / fumarate reductase cytochrome b subunit